MNQEKINFKACSIANDLRKTIFETRFIYDTEFGSIATELEVYLKSRDVITTNEEAIIILGQLINPNMDYNLVDNRDLLAEFQIKLEESGDMEEYLKTKNKNYRKRR